MTRSLLVLLSALAVGATAVAVGAGPNFAIALPAGVIAVLAAALLFVEAGTTHAAPLSVPSPAVFSPSTARLRRAFVFGRLGRETILETLDRLERAGPNPNLPIREREESRRLLAMSVPEFREYVRVRLDQLERAT